jgi:hypothetical protein
MRAFFSFLINTLLKKGVDEASETGTRFFIHQVPKKIWGSHLRFEW